MKNTLILGALILTIASLVTRVLGIAQRIPLQRILGDQGMATYGIAYNIYGILLIIATVGIPTALSKQMAEYHARGQFREAHQTFQASRDFSIASGVIAALLLYWIAPYYAVHISHDPKAVLSIQAIAPALLLFPLISIMRGYFQGLQFMMPTGLSQVYEQILRVGAAVALPLLLFRAGFSEEVAIAGASFGAVAGSFGAIGVLIFYFMKTRRTRETEMNQQTQARSLKKREIYRTLLTSAIPISLASTAIPIMYFIDSSTVIALLKGDLGPDMAKNMLGILTGRAQSLASIPPILAIAVSSAILPAVAAAYSRKDLAEVERMGSLSLRLTVLTGAPLAFYLTAAAFPVNGLLFSDTQGSWVIAALCFGSIFQITMMTSMAILQGLGKTTLPMWNVLAGVIAKAALNFLFAPLFGIYGIILATSIGFVVILALNLKWIYNMVPLEILGRRMKGFILASLAMLAITWMTALALDSWIPDLLPPFIKYGLICFITGVLSLGTYGKILLSQKGILDEDLVHLPARMRKWLKIDQLNPENKKR